MKPMEIEQASMAIIERELQVALDPEIKPIVKRVIHATADFSFAESMVFTPGVVPYARELLARGAMIVTDTQMALSGISKPALKKLGCQAVCFMADEDIAREAKARETTRARVSMEHALVIPGSKLLVCGNAPTFLEPLENHADLKNTVVIGVPVGLLTAIFMAFYCPKKLYGLLKPCTELLAGIPSIVYGFFGMVVIVPCIRTVAALFGADISGSSILAASVLLGIMILPTVIGVSEAALRAVPSAYYEGAVAMGARHERAIFTVMLPAAKSGVLAGVVLGIGRAIGETMAVIMVAGNQPRLTGNMLKGIRTMTANIVIEMGYATGLHREALIATGVVLFVFILIINLTFSILKRRKQA